MVYKLERDLYNLSVCGGAKSAMETYWYILAGALGALVIACILLGFYYFEYYAPEQDEREQKLQQTEWRELEGDAQEASAREAARIAASATLVRKAQWNL